MKNDVFAYLIDIDETHSITNTARRFFIAQQAVSAAIKKLEKELDCKLLDRSVYGAVPTEEGQKVIEYAKQMQIKWDDLCTEIKRNGECILTETRTLVKIICVSALTNVIIPKTISVANNLCRNTDIFVKNLSTISEFDTNILNNSFDICLVSLNTYYLEDFLKKWSCDKLHLNIIAEDKLVACVSNNSKYAEAEAIEKNVFDKQRHIVCHVLPLEDYDNNYYRVITYNNDIEFNKKMMVASGVISLMPNISYELYFKSKRFLRKKFYLETNITHAIIYYNNASSTVKDIVRIMQESYRGK